MASTAIGVPRPPSSNQGGAISGNLLHQGKFRGAWKKAWFVLDPPFLYQYKSEQAKAPHKAFYVTYVMSDRVTQEDLTEEVSAKYMVKLEAEACSLRLNIYTPNQVKVITAPTEDTMNKWLAALQGSVKSNCNEEALREKDQAAVMIKPLMVAQSMYEVDSYQNMIKGLASMGLSGEKGLHWSQGSDPRKSSDIAKSGKLKMLKSKLDGKTWEKYFFVLLGDTVYFYSSRKKAAPEAGKEDNDEDEEDDEDTNEMPWKGCINLTFAMVGSCPQEVSKKARVFQLKTPLRTFYIKARHEVDAEDWMEQFCHAQNGTPLEEREAKLRKFNVHDDPLARKLEVSPHSVKIGDILKHPLGNHFASEHAKETNPKIANLIKALDAVEAFKKISIPDKKMSKANKIYKSYIKDNDMISQDVKFHISENVDGCDTFVAERMFDTFERAVYEMYASTFSAFTSSDAFRELCSNSGPKVMTISNAARPDDTKIIEGQMIIGRSSKLEDDGINLPDDHKVSREHCRLDVGPLVVVATDLGSSKGTRIDAKDGNKITEEVLLPGQVLFMGGYQLSYGIARGSSSPKKSTSTKSKKQIA